jgi:deoxyinosine 3'endonuclease (endonuclease V)
MVVGRSWVLSGYWVGLALAGVLIGIAAHIGLLCAFPTVQGLACSSALSLSDTDHCLRGLRKLGRCHNTQSGGLLVKAKKSLYDASTHSLPAASV